MNLDVQMVFTSMRSLEAFVVRLVLAFLKNVYLYCEESNFSSSFPRTKKAFPCSVFQKLLHL